MKRRVPALLAASALALGAVQATAPAASAQATPARTALAGLLTSDGDQFDKNKPRTSTSSPRPPSPSSARSRTRPVALVADGTQRATVFAPTDQAFRLLAKDLTGKTIKSEKKIFDALVELAGVDTIETVLLYHVIPGKTLTSGKVLKADGAKLMTAAGKTVKVDVRMKPSLRDHAEGPGQGRPRPAAPCSTALDLNKGNKQVAHGIDRVLRPINL